MNIKSKDEIRDIIAKDLLSIHNRSEELHKHLNENFEDSVAYIRALVSQLSQPSSGPLVTKTPKIVRKKTVQRIETIPEDEVLQQENISSADSLQSANERKREASEESAGGRVKRSASKKAADNIKKQYSITLSGKLRRPSDENENTSAKKINRESQVKRKKSASSSDEEDIKSSSKYSKVDENLTETKRSTKRKTKKKSEQIDQQSTEEKIKQSRKNEGKVSESSKSVCSSRSKSSRSSKNSEKEVLNKNNDVTSNTDDTEEPSMYEDAIGKPIPIMNSTMKSSCFMPGKILDATVVLGRLSQQRKLNETVVIQKTSSEQNRQSKKRTSARSNLQSNEQTAQCNNYNDLITDDESSPEAKKQKKRPKYLPSTSSEDEIPNTPNTMKTCFKDTIAPTVAHETKTIYKSNVLFSPYAKESVKKRVEAFEQVVMYSPKSVDTEVPTRVTRTKARAMAAAENEAEAKNAEKNVAQILARKSLAKAKRISLAKQKKANEEYKENKEHTEQVTKLLNDKPNVKQSQLQRITPLGKIKPIQSLISGNRIHTPLHSQNLMNGPKALTASRTNIVSNIDSFIQPPKTIHKINSIEKLEEKKRHEEDARKKREEVLRLQTEEKKRKRQEKELKNKLAREAKERQELEKRQKAEREREEKARLALQVQEKQREELERKRHAQLQRAQEKEERRKLEEQQRLQKLQEQEETERLLAEQKRREQEAEKRKEAEARAAEALKHKSQMLAAQAKHKQANNKNQGAINYILDSEPDDDESDDENRPKHEIPYWAQPNVRKAQLAMQRYINPQIIHKFFETRKCTPNLAELFVGIDRSRLERTSSAIWKTPPRFSMMERDT